MNCVAYGIVVYGGATVIDFGDAPYAVDLFGTSTGVLLGVHHEACHVAPAHEPQNRPWPVSEGGRHAMATSPQVRGSWVVGDVRAVPAGAAPGAIGGGGSCCRGSARSFK